MRADSWMQASAILVVGLDADALSHPALERVYELCPLSPGTKMHVGSSWFDSKQRILPNLQSFRRLHTHAPSPAATRHSNPPAAIASTPGTAGHRW